jgi:hypothetical protein
MDQGDGFKEQAMDPGAIEGVIIMFYQGASDGCYKGARSDGCYKRAMDQEASYGSGSNRRSDNNVLFLFMSINDNVENK